MWPSAIAGDEENVVAVWTVGQAVDLGEVGGVVDVQVGGGVQLGVVSGIR